MRALTIDDAGVSFRRDYPEPILAAGESLVRVSAAGICGTDLELARGYMGYRGVPGHEFVGVVERSAEPQLVGRRVAGEINAACGDCDFCRRDLGRHCARRTVLGILGRDGAFADYLTLPDHNLIQLPDSLPDEVAVFIEPLAAAYEICEQVELSHDEKIAVLGDGRLGALVALTLQESGYAPIVGGHHPHKLEFLAVQKLQVEPEEHLRPGFDCVIDCTGSPAGLTRSLELVRPRGRVILKSTAADRGPLNLAPVVINEVTIIGSRCGRFGRALAALDSGKIDPRWLISARYPLEDARAALDAAGDPKNFKVLLQIS
jgi:2-desacetyl-2-hydroxyethyl bacteriochlorophyllide A dehydrogenase